MPKHNNESDLAYKRRVIDIKSESFCGAKWYNATIWLGSGLTTSCHHPPAHKIPPANLLDQNPSLIHNTPEKKNDRHMMQQGQRPSGCDYCWKIEDMNTDAISDRVYKTVIYTDEELNHAFNTPPDTDIDLRTLEIAFDRTCQFACSYCNPAFSSTWVNDIRKNGAYTDLVSDGRGHFTHTHDHSQLYKLSETNPYVEAFFRWWETDLHRTLRELRITGGEPLMSGYTWKLLDWFRANKGASTTRLAINTNLGPEIDLERLFASVDQPIDIYTSNEATGLAAEYIRDGLNWQQWLQNVESICTTHKHKVRALHIMCTINALCLESLPDFLELLVKLKTKHGRDFPSFTLNILRFPSFQSVLTLPLATRSKLSKALVDFLVTHKGHNYLHAHEIAHVERLIDYLVNTPEPQDQKMLQKDFCNFYAQYDARRNKNFHGTFPMLKELYDQNSIS
jgi:organic radical activating enzyme